MRGGVEGDADRAQLASLFEAHYSGLHAFCVRVMRDESAADDLVQGVFVRLWMRRDDRPLPDVNRAYLYRSVRNAALSWLRRRDPVSIEHLGRTLDPLIDPADPGKVLAERELRAAIARSIDRLPPRCREVFVLVRERGLSYREAAEVLGVSAKTVDAHMVRAMQALRSALTGGDAEENGDAKAAPRRA